MFQITKSLLEEIEKVPICVPQKCIDNAVDAGMKSILSELPEEAQTVEIVEHVLHEMLDSLKQRKITL